MSTAIRSRITRCRGSVPRWNLVRSGRGLAIIGPAVSAPSSAAAFKTSVSQTGTPPRIVRRLDGTKHYPEDIVGEVHDDGEIWSAALWQIRGAITAAKADTVILQHHFLLTIDTSFNQAANALVTAAINLGYNPPAVNAIRTILQNRGFTVTV